MKIVIEVESKTYSFERKRPEYDSDVLLEEDIKDIAGVLCLAMKSAGTSPTYLANQMLDDERQLRGENAKERK